MRKYGKPLIALELSLAVALCLAGCSAQSASSNVDDSSSMPASASAQASNASVGASEVTMSAASSVSSSSPSPYATENRYDVDPSIATWRDGTDYGTIDYDVTYYSTAAGDEKACNVLLPAGYDPNLTYPVMYVIHGFNGSRSDLISEEAFLPVLYGNMLQDGLAQPQIIVSVDMYTDMQDMFDFMSDEDLRFAYDGVVDDIANDLMPFIEERYAVAPGRENTAVAGLSQGASEALCTGFKWLDKIGYIGSFAPDAGVIPTSFYEGTFWNVPYFDDFPVPTAENEPYYLYMSVGTQDPWNVDCTLYYAEVLDGLNVRNQTDLVPGYAHDDAFWLQCFYNFLAKTFR